MKYKIIGFKVNEFARLVKCELYRDTFEAAQICKHNMRAIGYIAKVSPTAEVWTQELELS